MEEGKALHNAKMKRGGLQNRSCVSCKYKSNLFIVTNALVGNIYHFTKYSKYHWVIAKNMRIRIDGEHI